MTRKSRKGSPEPEPNPLLRLLHAGRNAQRRHAAGELAKLPWSQPKRLKFDDGPTTEAPADPLSWLVDATTPGAGFSISGCRRRRRARSKRRRRGPE
jgi:hypothetical protein